MNVKQMKTEELQLIKMGLDAIYVHDSEDTRLTLLDRIEGELLVRSGRVKRAA